jgi:hypothetical protein
MNFENKDEKSVVFKKACNNFMLIDFGLYPVRSGSRKSKMSESEGKKLGQKISVREPHHFSAASAPVKQIFRRLRALP